MDQIQPKYAHPIVATDTILLTIKDREVRVLLMKMKEPHYRGFWAAPGYILETGLSLKENALKYLDRMGGITRVPFIDQIYAFGKPGRDPAGPVISVAFLALIHGEKIKLEKREWESRFFPIHELPKLAYDHDEIIREAYERLRSRLIYSNVAYALLAREFTLTELQNVYEKILGISIDKRNFRKKILNLKLVQPLGKKTAGKAHRPAELYEFKNRKYELIPVRLFKMI